MYNFKRIVSLIRKNLKLELMASVLICLIIAFCSFLFFYFSMYTYHQSHHNEESAEKKMQALRRGFQVHVLVENVSSADIEAAKRWARSNRASVFIGGTNKHGTEEPRVIIEAGPDGAIFSISAIIRYRDGEVPVLFSYNHSSAARFASWVVSLLLAFDVFLLLLFYMLKKKLDYVQRIERGIGILESGRLNHMIPVEGSDELARLAVGLNHMSCSIQTRIESEQKALAANRQIIGDLSHDIRTPLTVGMGYLALLLEKEKLSEQERKEYLALVMKKAEQIEERTRMLLEFSTLTSGQLPVCKTTIDARALVDQLKEELSAIAELRIKDEIPARALISGDTKLLERLFDNLLSNLKVHGDTSCPVYFRACLENGCIRMEIENTVSKEPAAEKGSLLGLKICTCILELHGGHFETSTTEDAFRVIFSIPAFIKHTPATQC